jgi:4'-phosphopantetheinyl transferase
MKFRFTADQKRALVSRLLQRRACFEATGVPWKSVSIARTKGGKPFMANKPMGGAAPASLAPNWNFNVSHEGKYVVLAAEPNALCGVDVAAPEESRALAKKRAFSEQLDMMKGQLSPSEVRRRRRRALEAPARARARSAPHDAIRSAALPFGPTLRL